MATEFLIMKYFQDEVDYDIVVRLLNSKDKDVVLVAEIKLINDFQKDLDFPIIIRLSSSKNYLMSIIANAIISEQHWGFCAELEDLREKISQNQRKNIEDLNTMNVLLETYPHVSNLGIIHIVDNIRGKYHFAQKIFIEKMGRLYGIENDVIIIPEPAEHLTDELMNEFIFFRSTEEREDMISQTKTFLETFCNWVDFCFYKPTHFFV